MLGPAVLSKARPPGFSAAAALANGSPLLTVTGSVRVLGTSDVFNLTGTFDSTTGSKSLVLVQTGVDVNADCNTTAEEFWRFDGNLEEGGVIEGLFCGTNGAAGEWQVSQAPSNAPPELFCGTFQGTEGFGEATTSGSWNLVLSDGRLEGAANSPSDPFIGLAGGVDGTTVTLAGTKGFDGSRFDATGIRSADGNTMSGSWTELAEAPDQPTWWIMVRGRPLRQHAGAERSTLRGLYPANLRRIGTWRVRRRGIRPHLNKFDGVFAGPNEVGLVVAWLPAEDHDYGSGHGSYASPTEPAAATKVRGSLKVGRAIPTPLGGTYSEHTLYLWGGGYAFAGYLEYDGSTRAASKDVTSARAARGCSRCTLRRTLRSPPSADAIPSRETGRSRLLGAGNRSVRPGERVGRVYPAFRRPPTACRPPDDGFARAGRGGIEPPALPHRQGHIRPECGHG